MRVGVRGVSEDEGGSEGSEPAGLVFTHKWRWWWCGNAKMSLCRVVP